MTRTRALLLAAVAVAIGARLVVLASPVGALNGDEAVTAVMAARIAHGHLFTFFAGQSYFGALEAYLLAPVAAFAPHNAYVLRLPIVAISAVTCVLVYRVGSLLLGSERRGLVAAWVYAVGPAYALLYGARAMGAYAAGSLIAVAGLLLAIRRTVPSRTEVFLLGLCAGLGAWATVTTYYLLAPALLWAAGSLRTEAPRRLLLLLPGAAVGGAPLWVWMIRHHALAGIGSPPHLAGPLTRAGRLVADVGPEFLGVAWLGPSAVLPRVLWWLAVALLLAALVIAVTSRRHGLARLVLLQTTGRRSADLILVGAVTTVALYVASPYTWYAAEPRYLYPALPLLAWALAAVRPPAVPVVVVAALSVSALLLHMGDYAGQQSRDLRAAARWLRAQGATTAYADFRTAYPTDAIVGSRLAAVPWGANACRFPDLTARVDDAERFGYLADVASVGELDGALRRAGVGAERQRFGSVVALLPAAPRRPWQLGLTTRTGTC